MTWIIKKFENLSILEIHKIYKERINIFILEQNCISEEIDDIDLISTHIFKINENNDIIAYGRVFEKDGYIRIGRILVKKEFRGKNLGKELLMYILKFIKENYNNKKIKICAQAYLERFYLFFGFKKISDVYIHEGREHVDMIL